MHQKSEFTENYHTLLHSTLSNRRLIIAILFIHYQIHLFDRRILLFFLLKFLVDRGVVYCWWNQFREKKISSSRHIKEATRFEGYK